MVETRRVIVIAATAIAALAVISSVIVIYTDRRSHEPATEKLVGSLFVSDAGQSHGGFEYTATYNVTVDVTGGSGIMKLDLSVGLGDILTRHDYNVTDFEITRQQVTMMVDGEQLVLPWVSNDSIWAHAYDDHYIASWGSDAPPQEIRGTIRPSVFSGIPDTYYVELRLS